MGILRIKLFPFWVYLSPFFGEMGTYHRNGRESQDEESLFHGSMAIAGTRGMGQNRHFLRSGREHSELQDSFRVGGVGEHAVHPVYQENVTARMPHLNQFAVITSVADDVASSRKRQVKGSNRYDSARSDGEDA